MHRKNTNLPLSLCLMGIILSTPTFATDNHLSDQDVLKIKNSKLRPKEVKLKCHKVVIKNNCFGEEHKIVQRYPNSPDYFKILQIKQVHKQYKGTGVKIGVMDSWFDYNTKNLKALSNSTKLRAPTGEFVEINRVNSHGYHGGHGNHVLSIIRRISPKSEIRYINFQAEQGIATNPLAPGIPISYYVKGLRAAINSNVDFLNLSLRFPSEGDRGPIEKYPIDNEIQQALIEVANSNIGIIVALGNDSQQSSEDKNLKSLFELAATPAMQGRMLFVAASQYVDGKERLAKFSNYPADYSESQFVVTAPGDEIYAMGVENKGRVKSGTSQAAPMVTGTAALIKQCLGNDNIDPAIVFDYIRKGSREKSLSMSYDLELQCGAGVINPIISIELIKSNRGY